MSDASPKPKGRTTTASRKATTARKAAPARATTARKAAPARATTARKAAPARKGAPVRQGPPARNEAPARAAATRTRASTVVVQPPSGNGHAPVEPGHRRRLHVPREALPSLRSVRVPGLGLHLPLPEREQLPWIAGVTIAAALDVIDWPVALLICVGHILAARSRNQAIRELAEGIETVV